VSKVSQYKVIVREKLTGAVMEEKVTSKGYDSNITASIIAEVFVEKYGKDYYTVEVVEC